MVAGKKMRHDQIKRDRRVTIASEIAIDDTDAEEQVHFAELMLEFAGHVSEDLDRHKSVLYL
jgi:hypothetical protein